VRKLTFGYLYDFRNPVQWHQPPADLYAQILEFISWTESLGFEEAWVPEHHGADDAYMPSPLVTLAAIAARTNTIKLGSAVALAPLYHPVRFAEDCAVLDILSNGRLEIGVAIGHLRREAEAYEWTSPHVAVARTSSWRLFADSGPARRFLTRVSFST